MHLYGRNDALILCGAYRGVQERADFLTTTISCSVGMPLIEALDVR